MQAPAPEPAGQSSAVGRVSAGPPAAARAWAARIRTIHWGSWLLIISGVLLTLTFLTYPIPPLFNDEDPSLKDVLHFAAQTGLQYGPDITYTYGPLGFLIFPMFGSHAAGLRLAVDLLECSTVAVGLCLLAGQLRLAWRVALLLFFAWAASNIEVRQDLVFNTGFLCWGLLCFVESGRRLPWFLLILAVFMAFEALAKVSFFFLVPLLALGLAFDLLLRGKKGLALIFLLLLLALFLGGWALAGQPFANLPTFVVNEIGMVRGYNAALGWEMSRNGYFSALLLSCLTLVLLFVGSLSAYAKGSTHLWWRRLVLCGWIFWLMFTVWKHGVVRAHDCNLVECFSLFVVLAMALHLLPCESPLARRVMAGLSAASVILGVAVLQVFSFTPPGTSLTQPARELWANLKTTLHPGGYLKTMNEYVQARRSEAQLPLIRKLIGNSSVDVFGQSQAFALANDLNYRPRPVFQTYAACNTGLTELNETFYNSERAPQFVLFRLEPLDRKFPSLEDGRVLRQLLANYSRVAEEGNFLLLKRNHIGRTPMRLLKEGILKPGQQLSFEGFRGVPLWLELKLRPTLSGRLRQWLCRPPIVRVSAWGDPGRRLLVRNRAPASMMEAGFLVSPLLANNADVTALYGTNAPVTPASFSYGFLPGEEGFWGATAEYHLYEIEKPVGNFPIEKAAAAAFKAAAANRPFSVFHSPRWRPGRPPPGNWNENLALGLFLVLPVLSIGVTSLFFRYQSRHAVSGNGWRLFAGNLLVFACLASIALLAGEVYVRFFYDTTDSLAFTKICERWVERHWHINGAGCRDDVEYSPSIAPGKRRITFIGDSFTAGHGIKDVENRFPNIIRKSHPDWEVHVLANVGLDTGGETVLLNRALAKGYQLDQVVLVYCLNDVGDLMPDVAQGPEMYFANLDQGSWLVANSYLINLFYFRYHAARIPFPTSYFSYVRTGYHGELWESQKQRLRNFRDIVEAHGGHLSVVTFPFLNALGPNYEFQFAHDELAQCWKQLGVPHLDLLSVYKGLKPSTLVVNPHDAHPNELACRLAARAIDSFLYGQVEGTPSTSHH